MWFEHVTLLLIMIWLPLLRTMVELGLCHVYCYAESKESSIRKNHCAFVYFWILFYPFHTITSPFIIWMAWILSHYLVTGNGVGRGNSDVWLAGLRLAEVKSPCSLLLCFPRWSETAHPGSWTPKPMYALDSSAVLPQTTCLMENCLKQLFK